MSWFCIQIALLTRKRTLTFIQQCFVGLALAVTTSDPFHANSINVNHKKFTELFFKVNFEQLWRNVRSASLTVPTKPRRFFSWDTICKSRRCGENFLGKKIIFLSPGCPGFGENLYTLTRWDWLWRDKNLENYSPVCPGEQKFWIISRRYYVSPQK